MYEKWSINDDQFIAVGKICKKLKPGLYDFYLRRGENVTFRPVATRSDDILNIEFAPSVQVRNEIDSLSGGADLYKTLGISQKRGILLYGPPGCGKSTILIDTIQHHIKKGGVAVFCKTDNFDDFDKCITALREIESDTSILVIVEDIDSITNNYDTQLCELLDGTTSSVEGICYLLTTNDIDKIPDRIKNRPSRIDVKIKIGPPDLPTRINFIEQFTKKVNFSINLSTYANKLDGFSFAKIKEFLIGVIIYKHSPETMISKLGE